MASSVLAKALIARSVAVVLAVLLFAAGLLVFAPRARAPFESIDVAPGQYTGGNLYVPGESMEITVRAGPSEVYDLQVIHWLSFNPADRIVYQTFDDVLIPSTGIRALTWTIPVSVPDGLGYYVSAHNSAWLENGNSGETYAVWPNPFPFSLGFEIRAYDFTVWTDRRAYLPGDSVTVRWAATMIQDGNPAPPGAGEIQVLAANGTSLISPPRHTFTESEGSYGFTLRADVTPDQDITIFAWFNETPARRGFSGVQAYVGFLGLLVNVPQSRYAPLDVVVVDITSKVTANPGTPSPADEGAPSVLLTITVIDLTTGSAIPALGATGIRTDVHGDATYLFQLEASPTSGTFEVQVRGDATVGSVTESDSFDIGEDVTMSVRVDLDRSQYLSGTTAQATATLLRDPPGTANYTWTVEDVTVFFRPIVLASEVGGDESFSFVIPSDFEGSLRFSAQANDGAGNRATGSTIASVAYGYLAMSLDRSDYEAGETITASYRLESVVITSPQYYWEVRDAAANVVASGSTTSTSFTYTVPDPASAFYEFEVTASQDGRVATRSLFISEASGYVLSIGTDKPSYLPGETIRVSYQLRTRGSAAMPQQFFFSASVLGIAGSSAATTSPQGELFVGVPEDANEGNLILLVSEGSTGTVAYETVTIGSTNPVWTTQVAGIPLLALILGLLLAVAFLAIVFLWRRLAAGAVRGPPAPRPAPPPVAPPVTPTAPLGPMSIPCKNCGTTIDITTSKRPIEVMCPSCGETQLVA